MRFGDWQGSVVGLFIVLVIKFEAFSTGNFEIKQLPFKKTKKPCILPTFLISKGR